MSETVSRVDAGPRQVSRSVVVHAPVAEVFALVANPHRHAEVDGSGTVRDRQVTGPDVLSVGAKFTVPMKQRGVPYKITSTVTAFEPDKIVEWRHPAGHRWRWEFAALDPDTTRVTETFDYTTSRSPRALELLAMHKQNAVGIRKTLERLQARFA